MFWLISKIRKHFLGVENHLLTVTHYLLVLNKLVALILLLGSF
jgi:hypothetical protein